MLGTGLITGFVLDELVVEEADTVPCEYSRNLAVALSLGDHLTISEPQVDYTPSLGSRPQGSIKGPIRSSASLLIIAVDCPPCHLVSISCLPAPYFHGGDMRVWSPASR